MRGLLPLLLLMGSLSAQPISTKIAHDDRFGGESHSPAQESADKIYLLHRLRLACLSQSQHQLCLRYWADGLVVDLWTDDGRQYAGSATCYATHYHRSSWIFSKQKALTANQADSLYRIFATSGVLALPTGTRAGMEIGMDGENFALEIATPATYVSKSYWSPRTQDSVPAARQVALLADSVHTFLLAHDLCSRVRIPPGKYTMDGGFSIIYRKCWLLNLSW